MAPASPWYAKNGFHADARVHAYSLTHKFIYSHKYILTHTHKYMHKYTYNYIHKHIQHTDTYTNTYNTHTYSHILTHIHTHTQIHTYKYMHIHTSTFAHIRCCRPTADARLNVCMPCRCVHTCAWIEAAARGSSVVRCGHGRFGCVGALDKVYCGTGERGEVAVADTKSRGMAPRRI